MVHRYLIEYSQVLVFIVVGFAIIGGVFTLSKLLRPNKPTPEKLASYECGQIPIGEPWSAFPIRYYFFALLFVVFDVEVSFLFPWAVIFRQSADWATFLEMVVFILILVAGLFYAWKKGALRWT